MNVIGKRGMFGGLLIGFVLIAVCLLWRVPSEDSSPRHLIPTTSETAPHDATENNFVGSAACAECHHSIADRYHNHPMTRSFSSLKQPGFEERSDKSSFTIGTDFEYEVERNGEKVFHHEIRRDSEGEVIYDQGVEVSYSIGSGSRGKGYVIERDDLLFMSPISWYAGNNSWGLSPGYSEQRNQRFERRVTDACLNCHTGRVSHRKNEPNRYSSPKILEASIGCERCHGPGEQHIAWRRRHDDRPGEEIDEPRGQSKLSHAEGYSNRPDPIVNPSLLEPRLREAICNDCHLQVAQFPIRYGRMIYDFHPGQPLEDVFTAFVEGDHTQSGAGPSRAVSHVPQMRESRCYIGSAGQLGCISCHDAHSVPAEDQKRDFYRNRCLTCHEQRGCAAPIERRTESNDSCIACHMPKLGASDVPHTSQTDHRILRLHDAEVNVEETRPSAIDSLAPFDDWDQRLAKLDVDRAWGLLYAAQSERESANGRTNALSAELRLKRAIAAHPDDVEALGALAVLYLTAKRRPEARQTLEELVRRDPLNEFGTIQLALFYHEEQDWPRSLQYWKRAIERNPWSARIHVLHGQTLVKAGRIEDAIAAARTALSQNPGYLPAHIWLAENLPRVGQTAEGTIHRSLVERLQKMRN